MRQDAAVLLHDRGADAAEVSAYVQRWSLVSADRAAQQIRFLTHPLWRAYISTYVEGYDLLSRWLAARPAGQPVADRFVRLLDEALTPPRWPPSCGGLTVSPPETHPDRASARPLDGGLAGGAAAHRPAGGSATWSATWPVLAVPVLWALVALRPRGPARPVWTGSESRGIPGTAGTPTG